MFSVKKKLRFYVLIKVNSKLRLYTRNTVGRASYAEQNLGSYRKWDNPPPQKAPVVQLVS